MNKKGQMVIFIIIAIALVGTIILIYMFAKDGELSITGNDESPDAFLRTCLRESAREKIDLMIPQGGLVNPKDFVFYNDIKVTYVCKNINNYEPCVTQYPRYITHLQEELSANMRDDIEQCFIALEDDLESKNYEVSGGDFTTDIVLKPGIVEINLLRDMAITKNGQTQSFDSFSVNLDSPLYDLGYVANEITRQEAQFCYFSSNGYSILYPQFDIRKWTLSDSTKIYTIKDKPTQTEMNIAIRGCVIPAGL